MQFDLFLALFNEKKAKRETRAAIYLWKLLQLFPDTRYGTNELRPP